MGEKARRARRISTVPYCRHFKSGSAKCAALCHGLASGEHNNLGALPFYGYIRMKIINGGRKRTIYIENDTYWNIEQHVYQHIVVRNCTTLKISGNILFHNGATIFIERNGVWDLDHCILKNASYKCIISLRWLHKCGGL